MNLKNKYYLIRHGQALSNVKSVCSCWPETFENPLTETGVSMVQASVHILRDKNIELIFSSDILRAKQTAQIVGEALGLEPKFDERLREINFGIYNGSTITGFDSHYPDAQARFDETPEGGENYADITNRMADFVKDIDGQYQDKTILIVSHEVPLTLLICKMAGLTPTETFHEYFNHKKMKNAEVRALN